MRRRTLGAGGLSISLAFLCVLLASECTRSVDAQTAPPPGVEAPRAAAQSVEGSVQGRSMKVESAVFLWRDKADDMQLVLSDSPGLCDALSNGAQPRGATVLSITLKHNTPETRDAAFGVGEYPVRSGQTRLPQDAKRALFYVLDDGCVPVVKAGATSGTVRLTSGVAGKEGEIQGELDLEMGDGDKLHGGFTATLCQPSELEPSGCR